MGSRLPESLDSLALTNEFISGIARCAGEAEALDLTQMIVQSFAMQVFALVVMVQAGEREHYRYLVGCDLKLCYRYLLQKWHAIDPFISYARQNTSPILTSDVPHDSEGQQRMKAAAEESGFRGGIAIPAHSSSSALLAVLYLGTDEGPERARQSLTLHRGLMRALALELLEWWSRRLRDMQLAELDLDDFDIELLCKARDRATTQESARELGLTVACVKTRYEKLIRKLESPCKRSAVEKAVALGLITPLP